MCGILFAETDDNDIFIKSLQTLEPRGPDASKFHEGEVYKMGHTRLAIVNPHTATQPIVRGPWRLVFNGEIYNNYKEIHHASGSDGVYILDMVDKHGPLEAPKYLDGIFGYVLYNINTAEYYAVRDTIGVIPLYIGVFEGGCWIASELKALEMCEQVAIVPPGYVITRSDSYRYKIAYPTLPIGEYGLLRDILIGAVERRIPRDVPWGVLLSGGLDSSIICGILSNIDRPRGYPTIHSFTIGLKGSPDIENARKQAELCNTVHHEFTYTVEQGHELLMDTVYAIESYDVTTVRASVPQYILASIMKKFGIKVVLGGEGSDELFGGYLYNRHCPTREEMQKECIRKMEDLHYYDCCRTNKTMASNGIECRVPFLDKTFVRYAMNIDPKYKMSGDKIEKHILREAFKDMLHPDIYTRQKAQFSDAVGSKWIDSLKEYAETQILTNREYEYQPPMTKEAEMYRDIFHTCFNLNKSSCCKYHHDTIACSSASAHTWGKFENDPSAKSLYK